MNLHVRTAAAVSGAVLLCLAAAACGSDDDKAADPGGSSSSAPTMTAAQTAACDALIEIPELQGKVGPNMPSKKQIGQFRTLYDTVAKGADGAAATAASAVVRTIDEATQTHNPKLMDSDEFNANLIAPAAAGVSTCAFPEQDVDVTEMAPMKKGGTPMYHFKGLPATLSAGKVSLKISSKSGSPHEMILVKVKDTTTKPRALLDEGDDAFFKNAAGAPVVTFVAPHRSAYLNADLSAGRYIAFCHVPLMGKRGPVDAHGNPTQDPSKMIWHFDLGMATSFTVG